MEVVKFIVWVGCIVGLACGGMVMRHDDENVAAAMMVATSFAALVTIQW